MRPLNIGKERALQKIRQYCAYQERNHKETRDKLYSFGLYKQEVEEILATLVEDNYLNEERFAVAFAGGKFRMKQWGKVRIRYELKQKAVSDYCIRMALAAITEEDYEVTLRKLAEAKLRSLKAEANQLIRRHKAQQYLIHKGFEPSLVQQVLARLDEA